MRIYFEDYYYDSDQIKPYLDNSLFLLEEDFVNHRCRTDRIGYIFVSTKDWSGPVFILPKSFLIEEGNRRNVLGMQGIYPEDVIRVDDPDNPLEISGNGSFLPELGLWLYRALNRFLNEHIGTSICDDAKLEDKLPENNARDKDFLSTALDLIDFLKEHRSLFTQISLINHSGNDKIDWGKTVKGNPFFQDGLPWYFDPAIKEKTINIDDTLIVLYYSVLKYLRDKYRFPIDLGDVPYELLPVSEIQRLIDTGIGSKEMRRIRHHYFRDDLKHLWGLLDSFFTYNISDKDNDKDVEHLLVRKFNIVFEAMIDAIISDRRGVEKLKAQDDGHLIDHIFRFTSLIGKDSDIYYIGDSKYYRDDEHPEGVALYKQFTYAKNAIQYHIDKLLLANRRSPSIPAKKGDLRYRDSLTEGYNITPNFFIRSRVTKEDIDFSSPSFRQTFWDKSKGLEHPEPNKHFEDRLFDRDTLLLREFSINFLFVIAAYAGYEDTCWSMDIHKIIRDTFIEGIDREYEFYILTPSNGNTILLDFLYRPELAGKTYTLNESDGHLIVAFEKSDIGERDKQKFLAQHYHNAETGEEFTYTLTKTSLKQLSE